MKLVNRQKSHFFAPKTAKNRLFLGKGVGSNPATPAKRHGFDRVFFVLYGLFGKNRTSVCDYLTRSGLRFSVQISVLSRIEFLRFRLFKGCRDMRVYLFRGREVFVTEPFLHDFDIHAPLHAVCSERMPQHVQGERERKFLLYLYDFLLNSGERHIKDMFPFAL